MLILSRKVGEELKIGPFIEVVLLRIAGNRATLGIAAPEGVPIVRGEIEMYATASEPSVLEQIRKLCQSRNHPGVNTGAHQLASDVLAIIGGGE